MKEKERGISSIIGTLLVVVITIVLFSASFIYITNNINNFAPSKQSYFAISVLYPSTSGSGYFKLNIKNEYGDSISTMNTEFEIVVIQNKTVEYKSHMLSEFVHSSIWRYGQNFTYNSQIDSISVQYYSSSTQIYVGFVNMNNHNVIWYSEVTGVPFSRTLSLSSFTPVNVSVGKPVNLIADIFGGDPPYHLYWNVTGPQYWLTNNTNVSTLLYPSSPGIYVVNLTVYDSFNATDVYDPSGNIVYNYQNYAPPPPTSHPPQNSTPVQAYSGFFIPYLYPDYSGYPSDLSQHSKIINGLQYEAFGLTSDGNLAYWGDSGVTGVVKGLGIPAYPMIVNSYSISKTRALLDNPNVQKQFINSAIQYAQQNGYSGYSIDFEPPNGADFTIQDSQNFVDFLNNFANALHQYGLKLLVAIDPAYNGNPISNLYYYFYHPDERILADYVEIMAYEGHFSGPSSFQSAVNSIVSATGSYLSLSQIIIILSTINPNTKAPFTDSQEQERINYTEQNNIKGLSVWSMSQPGGFPQPNLWNMIAEFEGYKSGSQSNSTNQTNPGNGIPQNTTVPQTGGSSSGYVGPKVIYATKFIVVQQNTSLNVIPSVKFGMNMNRNTNIHVNKNNIISSSDPSGIVEDGYNASYPTLSINTIPGPNFLDLLEQLSQISWGAVIEVPEWIDEGEAWFDGGAQINVTGTSYYFIPPYSEYNVTTYQINVYEIYILYLFILQPIQDPAGGFIWYPEEIDIQEQMVYITTFTLYVFPVFNATVEAHPQTVGLNNVTFYATFNNPIKNGMVYMSIPQLFVNNTQMNPVPGTGGYTYYASVYLPYTQGGIKEGYVNVYITVYSVNGTYSFTSSIYIKLKT
ncbi:MAG: glycosyl hydrolase family 18 protein [Thermoplasmata archaeon]